MKLEGYIDPFSEVSKELSLRVDEASINQDVEKLYYLIEESKKISESEDDASRAHLYYTIGTAYGEIYNVFFSSNRVDLKSEQIHYYRKSIELVQKEEFNKVEYKPYIKGLERVLYTNYGNVLDTCGRKIAAIEQYKKALNIDSNFGMALGNLGIAYQHYAMLISNILHKNYLNYFAYYLLKNAVESNDPNIYEDARNNFKNTIESYDPKYINDVLMKPLDIQKVKYGNNEEYEYRNWVLNNNLFLNPLNDSPVSELCFAEDIIQLPAILTSINEKPVFHGMFNQFKQEYIYARYEFYECKQVTGDTHFADKGTYLVNFADYPQYSVRVERLKSSFKTLYSMLDKIAFFINSYFKLGINERDVSFHSIWNEEKKGRSGYKYKNILKINDNFALDSIYWISRDFYEKVNNSPNPKSKRVRDIRNALEHKYVKIYWDEVMEDRINGEVDDLAFYISESELIKETYNLLKLIREVIICLSLTVGIEEQRKRQDHDDSKSIPTMALTEYDDDWKF